MKTFFAASALALSLALPAQALTVADITLAPQISPAEQTLNLYGAGVRSKFFMDLYVGSLYAEQKGLSTQAILSGDKTVAVRLNILSDMITSERMVETIEEGFETATNGKVAPLRERLDQFISVFDAAIAVGDQFTLLLVPGKGLITYKNGKQLAVTEGSDFSQALFAIWLGEEPADSKLKKAMLAQ